MCVKEWIEDPYFNNMRYAYPSAAGNSTQKGHNHHTIEAVVVYPKVLVIVILIV